MFRPGDEMPGSKVLSENTQTFPAHLGQHADVLITAPGRSPVVVEAEYEPAPEAEKDAAQRLGLSVSGEPRTIEAAIALRYPTSLEDAYDLAQAVANACLSYCVLYEDGSRFPESGWVAIEVGKETVGTCHLVVDGIVVDCKVVR